MDDWDSQFYINQSEIRVARPVMYKTTCIRDMIDSHYLTSEIFKCVCVHVRVLNNTKEEAKLEIFIYKEANNFIATLSVNSLLR